MGVYNDIRESIRSYSDYWRASSKLDRKALGIDWESISRTHGLDAYSAAARSAELARAAIKESLNQPKEDQRALFEARERKRQTKSAEWADGFMQHQRMLQEKRHAKSESCRNQDLQQTEYYHRRRLENQPVMEAADFSERPVHKDKACEQS